MELPNTSVFQFYEGTDPAQYTDLTGQNLNAAAKQLLANDVALKSSVDSLEQEDSYNKFYISSLGLQSGVSLIGRTFADYVSVTSNYGDSGSITLTKSMKISYKSDTQTIDLKDSDGNVVISDIDRGSNLGLGFFNPSFSWEKPAVKVTISNYDNVRNFFLRCPFDSYGRDVGYTKTSGGTGGFLAYFDRDTIIKPSGRANPWLEYIYPDYAFVDEICVVKDGEWLDTEISDSSSSTIIITKGWHYFSSYRNPLTKNLVSSSSSVLDTSVDIFRMSILDGSSEDLNIIVAFPSYILTGSASSFMKSST